MPLSDFTNEPQGVDIEDVHDWITEELPVSVNEHQDRGYSFYPKGGRQNYCFTTVRGAPRVYVDPRAKNDIDGSTPQVIRKNPNFDPPGTWKASYNYSYMIDQEEIPEELKEAIKASYELVTPKWW